MSLLRNLFRAIKHTLIRYPEVEASGLHPSTVLFLIRTTADFDHMLPIAYKCRINCAEKEVLFVCMDAEFNFRNTHMFRYLDSELNCRCVYIEELIENQSFFHRCFFAITNWLRSYTFRESHNEKLQRLFLWMNNSAFKNLLYDPRYYSFALKKLNVNTIFIDSVRTRSHRFEYYKILPAAWKLSIRVVLMVHTAPSMKEVVEPIAGVEHDNQVRYSWVDTILVPSSGHKDFWVSAKTPENMVHVVGNTRYSEEWLEIWGDYCGNNKNKESTQNNKINVILIEPPWSKIVEHKYLDLVERLLNIPYLNLRVLPHPRAKEMYFLTDKHPGIIEPTSTPSSRMVQWCDVAISEYSSLAWECLERNKFVLVSNFITNRQPPRTSIFEAALANSFNDADSMIDSISVGYEAGFPMPQENAAYQRLRKEIIYGGRSQCDVLSRYLEYIN